MRWLAATGGIRTSELMLPKHRSRPITTPSKQVKLNRNSNMTGTCPHHRVCGSSLDIILFHIAASTSGQRSGRWRRTLHQRWVTRLSFPIPRCVVGHPFPERRRRTANLSYRLGGGRQRAATISSLSSTKNRLERVKRERPRTARFLMAVTTCGASRRLRECRDLSILCPSGSGARSAAPRRTRAPVDLPLGALPASRRTQRPSIRQT